jgi:hypothetical protein
LKKLRVLSALSGKKRRRRVLSELMSEGQGAHWGMAAGSPLRIFGLSHCWVVEKIQGAGRATPGKFTDHWLELKKQDSRRKNNDGKDERDELPSGIVPHDNYLEK